MKEEAPSPFRSTGAEVAVDRKRVTPGVLRLQGSDPHGRAMGEPQGPCRSARSDSPGAAESSPRACGVSLDVSWPCAGRVSACQGGGSSPRKSL